MWARLAIGVAIGTCLAASGGTVFGEIAPLPGQQQLYEEVFTVAYDEGCDIVVGAEGSPAAGALLVGARHSGEPFSFLVVDLQWAFDSGEVEPDAGSPADGNESLAVGEATGILTGPAGGAHATAMLVRHSEVPAGWLMVVMPELPADLSPIEAFVGWLGLVDAARSPQAASHFHDGPPGWMEVAGRAHFGGSGSGYIPPGEQIPWLDPGPSPIIPCSPFLVVGYCEEYILCRCGDEPECVPTQSKPGFAACAEAAKCVLRKCEWAGCMEWAPKYCTCYQRKVKQIKKIKPDWTPSEWWVPPNCGTPYGGIPMSCFLAHVRDLTFCIWCK